jgi:hypothetical protein
MLNGLSGQVRLYVVAVVLVMLFSIGMDGIAVAFISVDAIAQSVCGSTSGGDNAVCKLLNDNSEFRILAKDSYKHLLGCNGSNVGISGDGLFRLIKQTLNRSIQITCNRLEMLNEN